MDELTRRQLDRELAAIRRETDESIAQALSALAAVLRTELRQELAVRDERIDRVHTAALRVITHHLAERTRP